ncbi:MAG: hypothetical protein AB8B52_10160 [Winogradskyella sp.]|uniref:hypothetical protein n=1 Tax=Winogradskyella sp. TaxID=1883156 RepID=UPI00385EE9F7
MNTLLIYAMLLLGHLCVYFYFKNNFKYLNFLNFNNHLDSVKDRCIEKPKSQLNQNTHIITDSVEDNKHVLLKKSLRHLEFIAEFEMYLEQKKLKNFSVEFLQEFEKIKIEAQLSALKTTNQLNTTTRMAA